MSIEPIAGALTQPRSSLAPEKVELNRKVVADNPGSGSPEDSQKIAPEEMLQQIKALTEDGVYSVRFESENERLIVKVVDKKTDEVIRQIPPEELIKVMGNLEDLRGNMVNTVS